MVREDREAQRTVEEFEAIFERYYRPVSYYFARRGFSPEECRDLAQETFMRAYKRWEFFDREQEKAWIFTIAANLYRNTVRDRRAKKRDVRQQSLSELGEQGMEPTSEDEDPVSRMWYEERRHLVVAALDGLPPRMRQCFLLRFQQGRKYKEIAEIMQISLQSVRSQLHQAKSRLQERLADGQDDRHRR